MTSVGRNDPCPCGSGRKYKKCCLEADAQRKSAGVGQGSGMVVPVRAVVTELDGLSNRVVDLLGAGSFDEAEAACHRLRSEYPDQVDGIWRLATVYEARGDRAAAARCYRDAAGFMQTRDGFEDETIAHMIESAERMEAEPSAPPNGGPATQLGNSVVTEGPPSVS
ncbi:MAG: SEC-C metal-binding domain-containing protein [Verrucomicrobia bacterium]|nr:SEC-C metal-binding domain-containing protein [Verrucomicrobiota bacterium]